jgi:general secretion pathway protein A
MEINQQAILNLLHNQRITPVLILDEMQMASNKFLNDLSLLLNFSMDSENPFVLCMTGLPHFLDKLKLSHSQPLAQRLVIRYQMPLLTKDKVAEYMRHHYK